MTAFLLAVWIARGEPRTEHWYERFHVYAPALEAELASRHPDPEMGRLAWESGVGPLVEATWRILEPLEYEDRLGIRDLFMDDLAWERMNVWGRTRSSERTKSKEAYEAIIASGFAEKIDRAAVLPEPHYVRKSASAIGTTEWIDQKWVHHTLHDVALIHVRRARIAGAWNEFVDSVGREIQLRRLLASWRRASGDFSPYAPLLLLNEIEDALADGAMFSREQYARLIAYLGSPWLLGVSPEDVLVGRYRAWAAHHATYAPGLFGIDALSFPALDARPRWSVDYAKRLQESADAWGMGRSKSAWDEFHSELELDLERAIVDSTTRRRYETKMGELVHVDAGSSVLYGLIHPVARARDQAAALKIHLALRSYRLVHGSYPVSLAELVPEHLSLIPSVVWWTGLRRPMDADGLFSYRRIAPDSFLLYIDGLDLVDNGGVYPPEHGRRTAWQQMPPGTDWVLDLGISGRNGTH